jgi:hypothetical protein
VVVEVCLHATVSLDIVVVVVVHLCAARAASCTTRPAPTALTTSCPLWAGVCPPGSLEMVSPRAPSTGSVRTSASVFVCVCVPVLCTPREPIVCVPRSRGVLRYRSAVRNSWGTYWGEDGFFRIVRGVDNCAIEEDGDWAGTVTVCKPTLCCNSARLGAFLQCFSLLLPVLCSAVPAASSFEDDDVALPPFNPVLLPQML